MPEDSDRPEQESLGLPLLDVVREIERYAAAAGWDRPPRLFALVPTTELLAREPALADSLGIDPATAATYTPVEQDALASDAELEEMLATTAWPAAVAGAAVVVERLVLPPGADADLPAEPAELAASVTRHAERQDVRLVVAVLRDGRRECAVRLREHDNDADVLTGPDLVPGLADALLTTLT